MASFFKRLFKKEEILEPLPLGVLKTDMHSHLIPGIDDGSPDLETSIVLLKKIKSLGYKKVITTPHIMSDYYKNTPEIIKAGLKTLQKEVNKQNIDITVEAAAEYYIDFDFTDKLENEELLTFDNRKILVETSFLHIPQNFDDVIFALQLKKYKVILAHPERYQFMDINFLKTLKNKGVMLQINILSLMGMYGSEAKQKAHQLIDYMMVDYVGTDCHNFHHADLLPSCETLPYWHKLMNSGTVRNASL